LSKIIKKIKGRVKKYLPESWILILVIIGLSLIIGSISPVFFTFQNFINIIVSISVITIIGVGMTMVILLGGIDVSVGSIFALTAVITGDILAKGGPVIVPIIIGILVGLAFGLWNGFFTAKVKIPALIVTLAGLSIGRGIVLIYTRGQTTYGFPESFLRIGQSRLLGVPIIVYITIIITIIAIFVLNRTSFGRSIYAIGNNSTAARISGIRVELITMIVFTITGFLCSISGLITIARMNAAGSTLGQGLEFQVITAVVLGGTSITGGRGGIGKTVIGAIIVGLISNGMQLLGVSIFYNQFISGLILLAAVTLDVMRGKKEFETL